MSLKFGLLTWTLMAMLFLAGSPAFSYAAACKGDKRLDSPMRVNVTALTPAIAHLRATGGWDKTGGVVPIGWRLYDSSGDVLDYFPTGDLGFAWNSMLGETNLEGLTPGASYTFELVSRDVCGHTGSSKQSMTMPQASSEAIAPAVSGPTTSMAGYGPWMFTYIYLTAADNTGVRNLSIYINGELVREYDYSKDTMFHWWCDEFAADGVASIYETPAYYVNYPDRFKGQYVNVEVVAIDWSGNRTTTSTMLSL